MEIPNSVRQQRILTEVVEERTKQDVMFGASSDDALELSDFVVICARHLGLACGDKGLEGIDPVRFRRQMIRLSAVAVAAVESLDRRTGKEYPAGAESFGSGW